MQNNKQGILIIIGGAEDKDNDCTILKKQPNYLAVRMVKLLF